VKQPQQVTARFATAMVPFGDLRDTAPPFTKDCAAKGTSRWIDATTWSFDFEKPLPGGVRCTFTMTDGLKDHDGSMVEEQRTFTFTTGGPPMVSVAPWSGSSSIDENQVFVIGLDADVDFAKARDRIGFTIDGLPERVEADQVTGPELDSILAALGDWQRPEPPLLAIRARRSVPGGRNVTLEWGAGIRSRSGEVTTSPQTWGFQVRSAFDVDVTCRRENARADCVPILPIVVRFSAPVARETARVIDPDVPPARRRLVLVARGARSGIAWRLDGKAAGDAAAPLAWEPTRGPHELVLVDAESRPLDEVRFEVKAPAAMRR
jgi:hypothetical protein